MNAAPNDDRRAPRRSSGPQHTAKEWVMAKGKDKGKSDKDKKKKKKDTDKKDTKKKA